MSEERDVRVHAAVVRLLTALEIDQKNPNYKDTPRRITAWLLEKFPSEDQQSVMRGMLAKKVFPSEYDGIIAQTGIKVFGLCPHHFKDIEYQVSIGYLPDGFVIGLSKLARLAEIELGVAKTQEDATHSLAEALCVMLHTKDVAVVVKGKHNCMISRGVKQQLTMTTTSEMWGRFRLDQGGIKAEFLQLVHNGGNGK